jgi:hypothetical protein
VIAAILGEARRGFASVGRQFRVLLPSAGAATINPRRGLPGHERKRGPCAGKAHAASEASVGDACDGAASAACEVPKFGSGGAAAPLQGDASFGTSHAVRHLHLLRSAR